MLTIGQVTTDASLKSLERNRQVKQANIRCHGLTCEAQAIRYSNLCSRCEYNYLNWNKAIFGKPSPKTMKKALEVIKTYYKADIESGLFQGWSNQIAQSMVRPAGKAISPLKIKDMTAPSKRLDHILAWRAKGKHHKGRRTQADTLGMTAVLNMLAYALSIDTLITPAIPRPVRNDYLTRLVGMRFMNRTVLSQTKMRLRMKRVETGWITHTDKGPQHDIKWVETEEPETDYYRIKSADYRMIGRRLWESIEKTLIPGARFGTTWTGLQDELRLALKEGQ